MEWRVLYPNAEAFAFPTIGSDRSPILLSLNPTELRRKKLFRFETYWLEHPECEEVVKKAWNENRTNKFTLAGKTRWVAAKLSKWSRRNFKNAQKQLTPLKYRLQELTNKTDGEQNRDEVSNIVRKMEELWRQEEMY